MGVIREIVPAFEGDRLALYRGDPRRPSTNIVGVIDLAAEARDAPDLVDRLYVRIALAASRSAAATRLQRIFRAMSAGAPSPAPDVVPRLSADVRIWRTTAPAPSGDCPTAPAIARDGALPTGLAILTFDGLSTPNVSPCEAVYIRLTNVGEVALDITGLAIDPTGRIDVLFPREWDKTVRLAHGQSLSVGRQFFSQLGGRVGIDDIVFVAVPAEEMLRDEASFAYLSQLGATESSGVTQGGSTASGARARDNATMGAGSRLASLISEALGGEMRAGATAGKVGGSLDT